MTKPYLIQPITDEMRRTSRNALRIEEIDPAPRCRLRPKDEQAAWLAENRPSHLAFFWSSFRYCLGEACETCPLPMQRQKAVP